MGGIVGLEIPALLDLAEGYGFDKLAMAELLRAAEVGVMAAVKEQRKNEEKGDANS